MAKEITRDAKFRLLGQDKSFGKTIDGAEGKANKFGSFMGKWAPRVAGTVAAGFAVNKIIDFGSGLLAQGNQLETWRIKSKTVFGDQLGDVQKWADANNEAFGVTNEELTGMAASMGDLLKPMGIVGDDLQNMTTETVELSAALSAWSGGTRSAAEVSDILTKAMLGETEQLKGMGIAISAAEIQTKALEQSGKSMASELTQQEKALATQTLIFEKSTDAQEAWANGSFDAIKAQNELKATFAEVKEELASQLLPVFQTVIKFLASDVLPLVRRVTDAFGEGGLGGGISEIGAVLRQAWPEIQAVLADLAGQFFNWLSTDLPQAIADAWPDIQAGLASMGESILAWIGDTLGPALGKAWAALADWVQEGLPPMLENLFVLIEDATDWLIETGLPSMAAWLKKEGPGLLTAWVEDVIIPMTKGLAKVAAAFVKWSVTKMTPKILAAAKGWAEDLVKWLITDAIPQLGSKLKAFSDELLREGRRWVGDRLTQLGESAKNIIAGWFTGMRSRIWNAASGIFDGVWAAFKAPLNLIIDAWNNLKFEVGGQKLPGIFGGFSVPTVEISTPNIDRLHEGGMFRAPLGQREGLAILESGEQVLPTTDVPKLAGMVDQLAATIAEFQRTDVATTIVRNISTTSTVIAPVNRTQIVEQHLHFAQPVTRDSVQWVAKQVRTAQRRGDLRSAV